MNYITVFDHIFFKFKFVYSFSLFLEKTFMIATRILGHYKSFSNLGNDCDICFWLLSRGNSPLAVGILMTD